MKKALITGIRGQDAHYLAHELLEQGYVVVGTSREEIKNYQINETLIPVLSLDLRNKAMIEQIVVQQEPDEIYCLAAQSSSSTFDYDPHDMLMTNGLSVVSFMEAIKNHRPHARLCFASSSETFAGACESPQTESTSLVPVNGYGAAKAYGHNMVKIFRERFDVRACTAVLYNHESPRRAGDYVTTKVCRAAVHIAHGVQKELELGDLSSQRDWSHARDVAQAMVLMLQRERQEDFVIASGQLRSVAQLCEVAFLHVGLDYKKFVVSKPDQKRRQDRIALAGNPNKALTQLGWKPKISFEQLIHEMIDHQQRLFDNSSFTLGKS